MPRGDKSSYTDRQKCMAAHKAAATRKRNAEHASS
jgi:hypothetical protein